MAKKLCYAKPTRSSWPLKQGRMGDLSQLKEDLEQKITTWQREVDLKLMKSVWGAHVRTPEEDDLSEECVCEPPRACLCCHRPPEMVERDLLHAFFALNGAFCGWPGRGERLLRAKLFSGRGGSAKPSSIAG